MSKPVELPVTQIRTSIGRALAGCVHDDLDLSLRQIAILFALHEKPEVSVRPLAAFLGLNNPAVSRGIERLVQLGLVTRQEDPEDRRRVILDLAQPGLQYTYQMTMRFSIELHRAATEQEVAHAV